MSSGITITNSDFDHALARLLSTSKRAAVEVVKQQARLLFVEVAKVTPPAGGKKGNTLQGRDAEKAGKLAITRDMHMTYGSPGLAYNDLVSKTGKNRADAFWSAYKNNRLLAAESIIQADLNKSFTLFDGGKANKGMRGKKRKKEPLFYIRNPDAMSYYIEELQQNVWYLASGWADPLKALGVKRLPYGVGKKSGPGLLKVEINDQRIVITMTNKVKYAGKIRSDKGESQGLEPQIRFAMKVRTGDLQRAFDKYLKDLESGRGFKIS